MWLVFVYLSLFLIMYLLLHILNSTCLRHLAINLCYLPAIANIIVFIKEKKKIPSYYSFITVYICWSIFFESVT